MLQPLQRGFVQLFAERMKAKRMKKRTAQQEEGKDEKYHKRKTIFYHNKHFSRRACKHYFHKWKRKESGRIVKWKKSHCWYRENKIDYCIICLAFCSVLLSFDRLVNSFVWRQWQFLAPSARPLFHCTDNKGQRGGSEEAFRHGSRDSNIRLELSNAVDEEKVIWAHKINETNFCNFKTIILPSFRDADRGEWMSF